MSKSPKQASEGLSGVVLLACGALAGLGLVLDLASDPALAFWIGAATGGGVALGAIAAVFVVGARFLARWGLRAKQNSEGRADAGPDA